MKLAIGCDHAGLGLAKEIMAYLDEQHISYVHYGTYTEASCNYPEFGEKAARAVASGECDMGILVCGTGIGISLAANKVQGIRAAVCTDCYCAEMTRKHNNSNMLALGARVVGTGLALKIVDTFLSTAFEGGRHAERVKMIMEIENR